MNKKLQVKIIFCLIGAVAFCVGAWGAEMYRSGFVAGTDGLTIIGTQGTFTLDGAVFTLDRTDAGTDNYIRSATGEALHLQTNGANTGLTIEANQDVIIPGGMLEPQNGIDFTVDAAQEIAFTPSTGEFDIRSLSEDMFDMLTNGSARIRLDVDTDTANSTFEIRRGDGSAILAISETGTAIFDSDIDADALNVTGDLEVEGTIKNVTSGTTSITRVTGGQIIFYDDDGTTARFFIDTSDIINVASILRPSTDNQRTLGQSGRRWSDFHAVNTTLYGAVTLGDAATDTTTNIGRMILRTVTDAGPMTATNGTQAEIVFNTSDSKFYGCTVTGTPATWAALN